MEANLPHFELDINISHKFYMVFLARKIHVKITLKQCLNFHVKFSGKFTLENHFCCLFHGKTFTSICCCFWIAEWVSFLCFPEWLIRVKRIGCRSTTWPSCSAPPSSGPRQSPQTWQPTWSTRAGLWSTVYWNLKTYLGEKKHTTQA